MSLGILQEFGIGLAVLLPLSVVWYGWRGLSFASKGAGIVKLGLAASLGVGIESLRRKFGISWGTVADGVVDGVSWLVENAGGMMP